MSLGKSVVNILYKLYKLGLSPLLGNNCRFYPTCADYAREAILVKGWRQGTSMAIKRLIRCHPYSKCDCFDPVIADQPDEINK
jgi:putative membrane protein insertion efficiency factor